MATEYDVWFDVQVQESANVWTTVADADTDVEAEGLMEEYKIMDPDAAYRIKRMRGQG